MNGLCSHERLELALAGKLDAADESMLQLHLDDCELCAAEIERLAGGEQASREIAAMLIPDELDDALPLREECSTTDFVVDHLEPSDDAAVLGRLGGYDVLDIIGRGGMGVVLKGFDRELKRFVAIKALAPHLAHSALARKRFAREAQAAAAVVNLHVIAIHQVQPNGQLPFLVMPLLTGESLAQRLKARGTLELKEILRIGMQAAEGLAAAHGQGLIHRDVKPANILLEKGVERAVLTDFGLARAADDVSMTRQGIIAGTPEYMSPEQARGEAVDGRSDLFSLGCVLYEMATGVSPFRTDSTMATLRRIVDEQPVAMASLVPELPPWFSHIVERLLSKDPAQRFASASEVGQLLEQCLSHLQQPTSVPLPASLVPHAKKSAEGRRSFFISTRKGVFAMLGAIGMTLLGLVLLQATEPPDISGQWTSEDWGTVVLEAKEPGEYEGTFTGSGKDKLAASNDPPGGSPSTEPGITLPLLGPGWIQVNDTTLESPVGLPAGAVKLREDGLVIADLNGDGQPEFFRADPNGPARVALNFQDKASDVTKGVDTGTAERSTLATSSAVRPRASGTLHLKWSRLERRFNGTWGKGSDRSGTMSLRLVDKEIRGGWTTDEDVQLESGTPLLGDLTWKRSAVTVPDGGTVLPPGWDTGPTDSSKKQATETITTTINPDVSAEGKLVDKDKLLNELRERDRQFSRRSVEMERNWNEAISPRGFAEQVRFHSQKLGVGDPGIPEGLPDNYEQPHRIRYLWTGQNFESTLEVLADLETAIHPEHGKLAFRTIESDCFNYHRIWDRDQEIFSHSSDIAPLCRGEKAWEFLLPSGIGFSPSILKVLNAVEVDEGYVLKGLISQPSATIGARKNCFELHLDKELILRKAVIQYHVYDYVIVTSGRREFPGMPPLAERAAMSIHSIGRDEQRIGDRGNFKYEVISLSDRLSKEAYDLRVHFAIPKGTKLATGLNVIEVNLQGLPGVTQIERDQPAPRPQMTRRESNAKVPEVEAALDRQNARAVVEAYVAAALRRDHETAASLAKNAPSDPKQIGDFSEQLNVQRLAMKSVYVNDPAKPVTALATSEAVKLTKKQPDGERDGFLVLTLTMSEEGWFVTDIDFESEEGADDELKKFLKANPKSIGSSKPGLVSSTPAAVMQQQQSEIFETPAGPAATPDSKTGANAPDKLTESVTPKLSRLPDDAYYKLGVHYQSFREEDAKRWGGELMGAVLEPSKPDERNQEPLVLGVRTASDAQWRIGGTAKVGLVVRNRTGGIGRNQPGSDVKFSYTGRLDNGLSVVAVDEAGKEHGATIAAFDSWLTFQHMLLPVAHVATIKEFTLRFDVEKRDVSEPFVAAFHLPPGKYKLRCTWNDARPDVAHEGEWVGELVNEELEFTLAAAVADPPPASEAPKATEKEPFTAWGEEVNGVQIGARLGEQRIYEAGESATLILRLRNNGKVQVPYHYGDEYFLKNPPLITDASGKAVTIKAMSVFGKVLLKSVAPGKEVDLVQLKLDLRPATDRSKDAAWTIYGTGKFQIQYPVAGVVGEVGPDLPGMKLTTGKLELEVKEPFTAWGEAINGLQAGLGFKAGEQRAYTHGETATLVLRVRNIGKEAVEFKHIWTYFVENPPTITDADGKPVQLPRLQVEGEPGSDNPKIAPGKAVELYEWKLELRPDTPRFGRNIKPSALYGTGKFSLQCERIVGPTSANPQDPNPALSKLATGKLELEIKPIAPPPAAEAPNAKLQPATETPGADIVKFPDAEYAKDGFPLDDLNGEGVMWNGEESGLSLGYRITGDEWRILGKELKVELWVRNAGKEDVKFQILRRTDEGLRVKLMGKDGREHFAGMVPNDVPLFGRKHLLSPGQCIKVNDFSVGLLPPEQNARIGNELRFFVSPGWYQLVCEVKVPGFTATSGDRKQTVPGAGEWTGTITTRSLNVEVVAPDAPSPKPRIEHADVDLEKDGTLYLNRKKVTLDELNAIAAKDAKKRFTIRADKDVPYAKVIEVVEALKAAGVTEFSFSEARVGDGKYRVANQTGIYEFDDKHGFSICRPSERPQWFTVSWPAEGDRPTCALRTFPNVSDKTYGKWAVVWEPGTDVLWWVDDSEVGKMTLTDPARVIVDREGRTNNFSRDFGLPEEVKTEFRRLGFVIGRDKMPELGKVAENNTGGNSGGQTIVSAEFGWWCIEGTVTDADGKPLANVPVRVSTNQEIKTEKTDAKGAYRVNFSLPLKLLAHSRAVTVKPVLEGFTERDMAKSGKFNVLLRAGEEPQRVRLADDKDFQPGPIPRFAERDLLPSQHGASPGKPGRADFVMIKAGEITSEIVPADGSGKAPVKVEAVAPSEGGAALKPDANAAVRVVEGAAPELRKSPPYNFRDSDQYRALDESSRSRLKTVVDDLAQLERALDSFMKDHDGTPPETLYQLVPKYIVRLSEDPFASPDEKIPDDLKHHQRSLDGRGYLYLQKPGGGTITSYNPLTLKPSPGAWQIQSVGLRTFPLRYEKSNPGLIHTRGYWGRLQLDVF